MVIDSSALVAIFKLEPEAERFNTIIANAGTKIIAAPTALETAMMLSSIYGAAVSTRLDSYISGASIVTRSFTADHAAVARQAFLRYGKGRHPAGLNFGDCIAYATARLEAMPLLFKGGDFRLTDIEAAA
jgi:ribonuclease VapC